MKSEWMLLREALAEVEREEGASARERLTEALRRGEVRARAETWYWVDGKSLDARGQQRQLHEIPVEFWAHAVVMWDEGSSSVWANCARSQPWFAYKIPGSELDPSFWYDAAGIHLAREDICRLWPNAHVATLFTIYEKYDADVVTNKRRPGPSAVTRQRVVSEMKQFPIAELQTMKGEAMAATFRASRGTCKAALSEILSELNGGTLTNSDQ